MTGLGALEFGMTGKTIHELLGLPPEVKSPHAYQVFGLRPGETSAEKIHQAIADRISHLKTNKTNAQADVWTQAAKVVQTAQRTLTDPEQKAKLDARFGIVAMDEIPATASPAESAPESDPLAALLPTANPLAVAQPETPAPIVATASATDLAESPRPNPSPNLASNLSSNPAPNPVVIQSTPTRARRRSKSGGRMMAALLLLGFCAVGGLAAFLFWGPGEVQFVRSDDGFTIRTGKPTAASPDMPSPVQQPPKATPVERGDGIMKPPRDNSPSQSRDSLGNFMSEDMPPPTSMPAMPDPAPPKNSEPSMPEPATPEPTTPEPTTPEPTTPEPGKIAAGQAAIDAAENAIQSRDWDGMKRLAEIAQTEAANDEQTLLADTLFQISDLATFYRGGVSRAMEDLIAGNEFDLTPNVKLLIVESGAQRIVVRRGATNYTYTLDEVPFVVADALADFQIPPGTPVAIASQAVYQSIAEKATDEVRDDAVQILRDLDSIEGADPQRIAAWLDDSFATAKDTP